MRILVYPHDLGIGGSQLNAIEMAAAVRKLGHSVVIFGRPGKLVSRVEELGLEFIEAPESRVRPSPSVIRALRQIVSVRGIDVVHTYEWPPAMSAWIACSNMGASAVCTVMSMSVAPFIPRGTPLMVGTQEIAYTERLRGRRDVTVIEPPVDLVHNDPARFTDVAALRNQLGLQQTSIAVVAISRFAQELKIEGLLTAIEVMRDLKEDIQLLLVGDGPARDEIAIAAKSVNEFLGRDAVVLAGELVDPRPAYAVADVSLGMGGSALRAMSFAKPIVVQGENGFWMTLDASSTGHFAWHGWYGRGDGREFGPDALRAALQPLLGDSDLRRSLGDFGRELVEERYSLEIAARRQVAQYEKVLQNEERSQGLLTVDGFRSVSRYVNHASCRKWRRLRGKHSNDDFNRNLPEIPVGRDVS